MTIEYRLRLRVYIGAICLFLLLFTVPEAVFAAGSIDINEDVKLTIDYKKDGSPISGAEFSIYKVADTDQEGNLTLTDEFGTASVKLNDVENWPKIAYTLRTYALHHSLSPLENKVTDANGIVEFPSPGKELKPGFYLIYGKDGKAGDYTYKNQPALTFLPGKNTLGDWVYEGITAYPKPELKPSKPGSASSGINRSVLKVWKDQDAEDFRPEEIRVHLLRDGKTYDTVALSNESNWRYSWSNLSAGYQWDIMEIVPEDYTMYTALEGITFVLTNTYDDPVYDIEDEDVPESPPEDNNGTSSREEEKLPQTGLLWWPVPMLTLAGMVFFLLGWIKRREHRGF